MSHTLNFKCNTTIEGLKSAEVIFRVDSKFTDDCFISVIGNEDNKLKLNVSSIGLKLEEHEGIAWLGNEKYMIKVYHGDGVDINGIKAYSDNAALTIFNSRITSNISIKNCRLINYNNCRTGGIIWIQGTTRNVAIQSNIMKKYGNDEIIAF